MKIREKIKNKLDWNLHRVLYFCRTHQLDNKGMGVVEIILIIVVLIGLVLIFKNQMTSIVNSIFKTMKTSINSV